MGTNLLTGHTDRHWKAVRKGVAPAFSAQHMRYGPMQAALLQPSCASHHAVAATVVLCKYMPAQDPMLMLIGLQVSIALCYRVLQLPGKIHGAARP